MTRMHYFWCVVSNEVLICSPGKLFNKFNHWTNYLVFISTISFMVYFLWSFVHILHSISCCLCAYKLLPFCRCRCEHFVNYKRIWSVTLVLYIRFFKLTYVFVDVFHNFFGVDYFGWFSVRLCCSVLVCGFVECARSHLLEEIIKV